MPRLRLVRHGHAAAGFSDEHDPGLDELGRAQADAVAATLAPLGPMPIRVSPLRRTRETAAPLEAAWGVTATLDERVAEIPSPTDDLAERGAWLSRAMAGTWTDLGPEYEAWRDRFVASLSDLEHDTVVVSHFIGINAVVGRAVDDDRIMHVALGNCSVTTIETAPGHLTVVELGAQAVTEVT